MQLSISGKNGISNGERTWMVLNVSFVLLTKYSLKLYELNEREVRNIDVYRLMRAVREGGFAIFLPPDGR